MKSYILNKNVTLEYNLSIKMTADMKNVMKFQSRDLLNGLASSGIGLANLGGVSMFFLFLLAMIPILWLVIALSVLKMPGAQSLFPLRGS